MKLSSYLPFCRESLIGKTFHAITIPRSARDCDIYDFFDEQFDNWTGMKGVVNWRLYLSRYEDVAIAALRFDVTYLGTKTWS